MGAKINIPPFLLHLTNDVKFANVVGSTVGDCLNDFIGQYPYTIKLLFDCTGQLLGNIDIYINGKSIYPEELTKSVDADDELSIVHLLTGG